MEDPNTIQRWEVSKRWRVTTDAKLARTDNRLGKLEAGQENIENKIDLVRDRVEPLAVAADGIRAVGKFGEWLAKWGKRIRNAVIWITPLLVFWGLIKALPYINKFFQ